MSIHLPGRRPSAAFNNAIVDPPSAGASSGRFRRGHNVPDDAQRAQELGLAAMYRGDDHTVAQAPPPSVAAAQSGHRLLLLGQEAQPRHSLEEVNKEPVEEKVKEAEELSPRIDIKHPELNSKLDWQRFIDSLDTLTKSSKNPHEIQQRKLNLLIHTFGEGYRRQAAENPHGKLLISRHTAAGKKLIRHCDGSSLQKEFNVHSILVDKSGDIFIRSTEEAFAFGGYKELFKAREYKTLKTYVWISLKKESALCASNSQVMQDFSKFLIDNSKLAFTPVPQFLEYEALENKRPIRLGVSIAHLYDGDAKTMRKKMGALVLRAPAILDLAKALAIFHRRDFVHRDIKSDNILLEGEKAFFHDYDFLCRGSEPPDSVRGTPGWVPLEYTLKIILKTPLIGEDASKADVFALALALFRDLEPAFVKPGFDGRIKEKYLSEIREYAADRKSLDRCSPEEQYWALYKWLLNKQVEHEALAPTEDDGKPYLSYRKLLWKAMSPDPDARPISSILGRELNKLSEEGELP